MLFVLDNYDYFSLGLVYGPKHHQYLHDRKQQPVFASLEV